MDKIMNFLKETKEAIKKSGHEIKDVMFIGSRDGKLRVDWSRFEEIGDIGYDNEFSIGGVADDLIVYFKDKTYLYRNSSEGDEWWEYNEFLDYDPYDDYKEFNLLGISSNQNNLEDFNK